MAPQNRAVGTGVKMNLIPAIGTPNRRSGAILEVGPIWWADRASQDVVALVAPEAQPCRQPFAYQ
jgi:hypothetical protein